MGIINFLDDFFHSVSVLILVSGKIVFGVDVIDTNLFVIVLSVLFLSLFCYFLVCVFLDVVMHPKGFIKSESSFLFPIFIMLVAIIWMTSLERLFS